MHYYQHHIGDFIKATARLTDSQTMAYLRLLWMYYDNEKPLKPDSKLLAFQIGSTPEDIELLLQSFFVLCDDGWHQTRCEQEIADYHTFRDKKSNAGKASAERRKNNSSTGVQQVLDSSSTAVQLTTNHKPLSNIQIKKKTTAPMPDGIDARIWVDWIALRKSKKAAVTETAIKGIEREAAKAGMTLEQVLVTCCERGWAGFKAEWVQDKRISKAQQQQDRMINTALEWLQESK
jgi:uncharacterized protein YdaU (DUF1376 family)